MPVQGQTKLSPGLPEDSSGLPYRNNGKQIKALNSPRFEVYFVLAGQKIFGLWLNDILGKCFTGGGRGRTLLHRFIVSPLSKVKEPSQSTMASFNTTI